MDNFDRQEPKLNPPPPPPSKFLLFSTVYELVLIGSIISCLHSIILPQILYKLEKLLERKRERWRDGVLERERVGERE